MTVYNVQIPVIFLVEAEDEADAFESEDGYEPEIR